MDSALKDLSTVRIIKSLAATISINEVKLDSKGAYIQSSPIMWNLCALLAKRLYNRCNILWKLQSLPYVVVEAERQHLSTSKNWPIAISNFKRVPIITNFSHKKGESGKLKVQMAKRVDNSY